MKDIFDMLSKLNDDDLDDLRQIIYEKSQHSVIYEGGAAIIGLSDLSAGRDVVYEGAPEDEDYRYMMALTAMVYTKLYNEWTPEQLGEYPPIAYAMGTVAAMYFGKDADGNYISNYELFKEVPYRGKE